MKFPSLQKLPNFSDSNYSIATYICGALTMGSSLFFIYEMFTAADFGIDIEWNIFKSAWFSPLFFIGLILAIVFWGKFGHWGGQPVTVVKDNQGNKRVERNDDVVDNMFGHFILPLVGHFVIEPIVYACVIFYPLMCVFAILGVVLPYVISIVLIGISISIFLSPKHSQNAAYRSVVLILITILIGGGLTWAAWSMESSKRTENLPSVEEINNNETDNGTNNETGIENTATPDAQNSDDDMFDDSNDMFHDTTTNPGSNEDDMFND